MDLDSKYSRAFVNEPYLDELSSQIDYHSFFKLEISVLNQRRQCDTFVEFTNAVDVVVTFKYFEYLEKVWMRDFAHHLELIEQALLSKPVPTLSNLSWRISFLSKILTAQSSLFVMFVQAITLAKLPFPMVAPTL